MVMGLGFYGKLNSRPVSLVVVKRVIFVELHLTNLQLKAREDEVGCRDDNGVQKEVHFGFVVDLERKKMIYDVWSHVRV